MEERQVELWKRYGKYGRNVDMENMEERQMWKDRENMEESQVE